MGRGKQAALLKAESDSPVSQDRHLGGRPLAHALAQLSQGGERHADARARSFGWRALIMCSLLLWERNPRLAQRTRENRGRMSNVLMWRFMPALRVPHFRALQLQLSTVLVVQIL